MLKAVISGAVNYIKLQWRSLLYFSLLFYINGNIIIFVKVGLLPG